MKRLRVGLVGARRQRQGLGPFVARDLVRAGAEVQCFLATSEVTRDAALAAGLHVLCEKPFVWGRPELASTAARLAGEFDARGLLVWENCQWPYTLPSYEQLFPGALIRPPERFEMSMQPACFGLQAFADSLPHALSLLQALVPGSAARIVDPHFAVSGPDAGTQIVGFSYQTPLCTTAIRVELRPTEASPRDAAFAMDGRFARRRIAGTSYRLSFAADDGRTVPLEDPMTLLVSDFVRVVASTAGTSRSREIVERMALLSQLVDAYAADGREQSGGAPR